MGIRGELFSSKVLLPNRTYFFNVKENRLGDLYLNIVESKNRDNGGFERQSVILFAEDLQEFLKGFDDSLKVMEKAMREKRNTGSASIAASRGKPAKREESGEEKPRSGERRERSRSSFAEKSEGSRSGDRRERSRSSFNEKSEGSRSGERRERSRSSFAEKSEGSRGGERRERSRPSFENKNPRSRSGERKESSRSSFDKNTKPRSGERTRSNSRNTERNSERGAERRPERNKRVVVRKRD